MAPKNCAVDFNPDADIPDLSGKVVFVTGGTAGVGQEAIKQLAKHNPAHVYFTGRNQQRADETIKASTCPGNTTQFTFVKLDMLSLGAIKESLSKLTIPRIDILLCNAGIMATEPKLSEDGFEQQFAINHLAHAAIFRHLLPALLATPSKARVIMVTSVGGTFPVFQPEGGIDFDLVRTNMDTKKWIKFFDRWIRYGQSKLANILYAAEIARRFPDKITAVSLHPGVSNTELVSTLPWKHKLFVHATTIGQMKPANEVAWNHLWCATAAEEKIVNGGFYMPVGQLEERDNAHIKDDELAKRLWEWTEEVLGSV